MVSSKPRPNSFSRYSVNDISGIHQVCSVLVHKLLRLSNTVPLTRRHILLPWLQEEALGSGFLGGECLPVQGYTNPSALPAHTIAV